MPDISLGGPYGRTSCASPKQQSGQSKNAKSKTEVAGFGFVVMSLMCRDSVVMSLSVCRDHSDKKCAEKRKFEFYLLRYEHICYKNEEYRYAQMICICLKNQLSRLSLWPSFALETLFEKHTMSGKLSRSEKSATPGENSMPHQHSPTGSVVDAPTKPSRDAVEDINDGVRSLSVTSRISAQEEGSQEDILSSSQDSDNTPGLLDDNGADPRKVFVGGLPWNTTNESFTDLFSKFGIILKSKIIRDSASGAARGYGFVKFQEASSAARAIQASARLELHGRRIDCKSALPTVVGGQHVRKLFVGGLPKEATAKTLEKHFGQYGKVINAVVMVDRSTAHSRGFGFVTMGSTEAALAILSTPQLIRGRRMDVHKALSRDQMEKERGSVMENESGMQHGYWPAANQYSVWPPAAARATSSSSPNADTAAEMGTPSPPPYMYHVLNMGPGAPLSPMPLPALQHSAGSFEISTGSVPILPGMGGFYPSPWAHLPYHPHAVHAGSSQQRLHLPHASFTPLPYVSYFICYMIKYFSISSQ
eukprot:g19707.t1